MELTQLKSLMNILFQNIKPEIIKNKVIRNFVEPINL